MTIRRWRIVGRLPALALYLRLGRWVVEVNR